VILKSSLELATTCYSSARLASVGVCHVTAGDDAVGASTALSTARAVCYGCDLAWGCSNALVPSLAEDRRACFDGATVVEHSLLVLEEPDVNGSVASAAGEAGPRGDHNAAAGRPARRTKTASLTCSHLCAKTLLGGV